MNKKTIKIAGWALGLSMAVAGIGAVIPDGNALATKAVDYTEIGSFDFATTTPAGSTSTALTTDTIKTLLNNSSSVQNLVSGVSSKTGDIYSGKGSGGGSIPQHTLKVGKASGGGSFTFTIGGEDNIAKVTINGHVWKTTSSISVNGSDAQTYGTAQSATAHPFDFVLATPTKTLTITVTTSAVCVSSISLYKVADTPKSLDHIDLGGAYQTSFEKDDTFSHEGMTVTAYYDDETSKDVTSGASFSGYDMASIGDQTVTVSYTENDVTKTTTYGITVTAPKTIKVNEVTLTGITNDSTLDGSSGDTIYIDNTIDLSASVAYEEGDGYKEGTGDVLWSSSNNGVATVEDGTVTLKGNGIVSITATSAEDGTKAASVSFSIINIKAKKGTSGNPYSAAEAREIALGLGSGTTADEQSYVKGIVSALADESYNSTYGNKTFWITDTGRDDEESELELYRAYYDADTKMTEEKFNSIQIGDEIVMCGYLRNHSGTPEMDQKCYVVSHVQETKSLSLSQDTDSLVIGSEFAYSGTVSTAFTVRDNYDVTDEVTFSGYDMSVVGEQEVTVTYNDDIFGEITATYTLNVTYAQVTSVSLTEHEVNVSLVDEHQFAANLNSNVDPSKNITWAVANGLESSIPENEFEIDETGLLTIATETSGTLIVTASCDGKSDTCTVNVIGDPYLVLNTTTVNGFEGEEGTVAVTRAENLTPTLSYTWSVVSGADVVSTTTGSASATLSFLKPGDATVKVRVTDSASKYAESLVNVHVAGALNIINATSSQVKEKTFSFSELAEQGTSGSGSTVEYTNGEITISSDKAYNRPSNGHMKVYAGGGLTISTSAGEITDISIEQNSSNTGFATSVTDLDVTEWSATNSLSKQAQIVSITVGYKIVSSTKVSNTNYNAQKAAIEFAESVTSKLDAVCDQVNGNTDADALDAKWSEINAVFDEKRDSLDLGDKTIFDQLIKYVTPNASGDALQKAISSYNYVYAKYKANLTDGDFLTDTGKAAVSPAANVVMIKTSESEDNTALAISAIAVVSFSALAGVAFLRRKRED